MSVKQLERAKRLARAEEAEFDRATGSRLSAIRVSKGVQALHVAARMGISASYVSDLEKGKRHWRPHLIEAYEKAIATA